MSPFVVDNLVKDILNSRVYDVAIESPLDKAAKLSAGNVDVYLKREDLQPVHSFKLRGAYNKMVRLSPQQRKSGVIAASAGNHAQGVALAANKLHISALIIMPRTTPAIKIDAVQGYGAQVELHGDNYSEAAEYCKQRTVATGRAYIHPFDDPLVIAGQGTIGREIIEQLPTVTHIFVPVGGGGLLAGVAAYVKAIRPDVQIIAVEPQDSCCMGNALAAGKRIALKHVGIFADGVAVKQAGVRTFAIAKNTVDHHLTVTTDQICSAIKHIFEDTRSIVEPSGALAVAGIRHYPLPKNAVAVAICSGANVTFERLQQVAERTLIGSGKEALFAVQMPELPGALSKFCKYVVGNRSITQFAYRLNSRTAAHVLVGISVTDQNDRERLQRHIVAKGYACTDLTADDLAKEHVRHMVGGPAMAAQGEHFFQVEFPERPGALADFLAALQNRWNISLFHYRTAASDTGSVFIGLESPHKPDVEHGLQVTGFAFSAVQHHNAVAAFLQ